MHPAMRYKPSSPANVRYIGAVEEYDIYVSAGGQNYCVRFKDYPSGLSATFPVKHGPPDEDRVRAALILKHRPTYKDVPRRISLMIAVFGQL